MKVNLIYFNRLDLCMLKASLPRCFFSVWHPEIPLQFFILCLSSISTLVDLGKAVLHQAHHYFIAPVRIHHEQVEIDCRYWHRDQQ